MRHARLTTPLPIGLLAPAVILLAYRRCLVSAGRRPHLLLSHSLPATVTAIALSAITPRFAFGPLDLGGVEAPARVKHFETPGMGVY
jgi:hypothetical protein